MQQALTEALGDIGTSSLEALLRREQVNSISRNREPYSLYPAFGDGNQYRTEFWMFFHTRESLDEHGVPTKRSLKFPRFDIEYELWRRRNA